MTRLLLCVTVPILLLAESSRAFSAQSPSARKNGGNGALPNQPSNKATQIMQGVGQAQVDLNQYNLATLDEIAAEWTANLRQKVDQNDVEPFLGVRSATELYVDKVDVFFPRQPDRGLGLQLEELAGGREDGLGITLISEILKDGMVYGCDVLPGDSIAEIELVRRSRAASSGLSEQQESTVVTTECFNFEKTVAAIQSFPPVNDAYEEYFCLTVKRIRRRPRVRVKLQYPPGQTNDAGKKQETIELFAGENLRMGMLVRGVKLNDPLAKRFDTKNGGNCGAGGLCRTCAVSVLTGRDLLNPQRLAEQQMLQDNPRWRLACKAIVGFGMKEGELSILVNPRQMDKS